MGHQAAQATFNAWEDFKLLFRKAQKKALSQSRAQARRLEAQTHQLEAVLLSSFSSQYSSFLFL